MRYLSLFLLLFSIQFTFAQNSSNSGLKGGVFDENTNPVPFANVALFSLDTTLIKGTTSNEAGNFMLNYKQGEYLLKVSFLSYSPSLRKISIPQVGITDLGKIQLASKAEMLNEVEITGEKSTMEFQLDKRVFNVEQDLANIGGDASDVLSNIPSVDVDAEGKISLRGSGGVRILINGRQSGLVGDNTADALKQIQSDLIEKVEVISNPSARYDAEGEVGIINIVLKKERRKGFNASVTGRTGAPHNHNIALNLNWRKEKINYFVNGGVGFRQSPGRGTSNQEFYFPDSTYSFERDIERLRGGLSQNIKAGADFFLSPKSIITTSVMYSYSDADNRATTIYRDFEGLGDNLLQTIERLDKEREVEHTIEYAINFDHQFKKKDHKLTADIRFINSDDRETSTITEGDILLPKPPINQRVGNLEYEQNLVGQLDYVYPFGNEGKFEAGLKSSMRNLENDFLVENLVDGSWEPLEPFNNNFLYTENIHAAYLMAGNNYGSFSAQLGLRAEYSDIRTELKETNEINPRNYLNLFPTSHLSYKLSETNSLQLSYARRIRRPGFWHLMPFLNYSDSRNFFSGNPNLDPEYTDSYEFGFLNFQRSGSIFVSAFYRHSNNNIQRVTLVDSKGFTRFMPVNAGTEDAYGLEVTGSKRVKNKFMVNGNINLYYFNSVGFVDGERLIASALTANGRIMSVYNFNKSTAAQLSFRYRAPRNTLQGSQKSISTLSFSFSKDLFSDKATLVLNVDDIFNTGITRNETFGPDFFSYSEYQRRVRQFTLSFTYRINQKKEREGLGRGGADYGGMGDDDM